jgi:3-methyl-2-oxobutanoate hydroxymethyltransferase
MSGSGKNIVSIKACKGTERLSIVTAYDYTASSLVAASSIDAILVGDSLGMVIQGHPTTLPVSVEEMLYHCRNVVRGAGTTPVIGDLPFGSYHESTAQAVSNSTAFMKTGVQAVKLEGARPELVEAITHSEIPVMGHLGLTPQSVHQLGGYRVQGKTEADRQRLIQDAQDLERAGAFAIVLELVTHETAKIVTESVGIPTIGIGSGPDCDGQVLVWQDLLGLNQDFQPKFVKQYLEGKDAVCSALDNYSREVKEGTFPGPEHTFYSK